MSVTSFSKQQNSIGVQSNHLKLGIIGTANVGKSTLFNLLVHNERRASPSENCLFQTIDPYIGIFTPHDPAVEFISTTLKISAIPASLTIADTAGLVDGSFREVIRKCFTYFNEVYCFSVLLLRGKVWGHRLCKLFNRSILYFMFYESLKMRISHIIMRALIH